MPGYVRAQERPKKVIMSHFGLTVRLCTRMKQRLRQLETSRPVRGCPNTYTDSFINGLEMDWFKAFKDSSVQLLIDD